jgi:catechol O-methyltransferase
MERKTELQDKPEQILDMLEEIKDMDKTKRNLIKDELHNIKPQIVVELGTFVGYSAIVLALELRNMGSLATVHTFDTSADRYEISKQIIELSGLQGRIRLHQGTPEELIESWEAEHIVERVNFILLNHGNHLYLSDLRALETLGLINPGTTIIADDCNGDYIEYLESAPIWRKEHNSNHHNINGSRFVGKWGILYDNKLQKMTKEGFPDAMVVSKCTGVLF